MKNTTVTEISRDLGIDNQVRLAVATPSDKMYRTKTLWTLDLALLLSMAKIRRTTKSDHPAVLHHVWLRPKLVKEKRAAQQGSSPKLVVRLVKFLTQFLGIHMNRNLKIYR